MPTHEVIAWASERGYAPWLHLHIEKFNDYLAEPKNRKYTDLDAAFRSCVRDDWGGLREKAQRAAQHGRAPDLTTWWKSADGLQAKAVALGMRREENEPWARFEVRVLDAAVDSDGWGAWVDPGRRSVEYDAVCQWRLKRNKPVPPVVPA